MRAITIRAAPKRSERLSKLAPSLFVAFKPAIVKTSKHYYAIPKEDSRTPPDLYKKIMAEHGLPLRACRPDWMNFDFIDRCYEVEENIYDPDVLRDLVEKRIQMLQIHFVTQAFTPEMRLEYDFVVWATYGLGPSRNVFKIAKFQVAEKMLVQLPEPLHHIALVVVDGPFTAFDPYGSSEQSLFRLRKKYQSLEHLRPQRTHSRTLR